MFARRRMLQTAIGIFSLVLLAFAGTVQYHAQSVTTDQIKKILQEKAGFDTTDISALDDGQTVVKLISSKDDRRVAVCGIVRVENSELVTMTALRDALSQRSNQTLKSGRRFGQVPKLEDLQGLRFDRDDIEDLLKCEIGRCDIKLPAAFITQMRTEAGRSADSNQAVEDMYRQMLVDYTGEYISRGDDALMRYDSRKTSVRLSDEYRMLLRDLLFINELVPEFANHIRLFPLSGLSGVEDSLDWSVVNFGLDPTIAITHTAAYERPGNNAKLLAIANKQIYASRYIDSSLALTILVKTVNANGPESYLIFANASRSGVLDGALGSFKRKLVGNEAVERVTGMLELAKARLKTPSAERSASETDSPVGTWEILKRPWAMIGIALVGLIAVFALYMRFRPR